MALGWQQRIFTGYMEEELERWASFQRRIRHMLPFALKDKLAVLDMDVEAMACSCEAMCRQLAGFVEKHGHVWLLDDPRHEALRDWLNRMREAQCRKLNVPGFTLDIKVLYEAQWEEYFQLCGKLLKS